MSFDQNRLDELQKQTATLKRLDQRITQLRAQDKASRERLIQLQLILEREQLDVKRLEGRSLAAFFYGVVGKKDEKLTRERREAYEAAVRYEAENASLKALERELEDCLAQRKKLAGCEALYRQALLEKVEWLKASGTPAGEKLLQLEEERLNLEKSRKELNEALSAGRQAKDMATKMLDHLQDAKSFGTWDLFGGGLLSDLAKYDHLDNAQELLEHLRNHLRRFERELADVRMEAGLSVEIDPSLRLADFIFDGLFADWAALSRIEDSCHRVETLKNRISALLGQLQSAFSTADLRYQAVRREIDILIKDC